MKTNTRPRRKEPHVSPPPQRFATVTLQGGPLNGQTYRIKRVNPATLMLRVGKDGPLTTYVGDPSTGTLTHAKTLDKPSRRRVPPAQRGKKTGGGKS